MFANSGLAPAIALLPNGSPDLYPVLRFPFIVPDCIREAVESKVFKFLLLHSKVPLHVRYCLHNSSKCHKCMTLIALLLLLEEGKKWVLVTLELFLE